MLSAALAISLAGALAQEHGGARLVAHVDVRSVPGLERFVTAIYDEQGFGDVFAAQPRFDALRALFPADVGERPCSLAVVLAADGSIHLIGLAPDASTESALAAPHARGGDIALHAFVEDLARDERWLVRADADDALARVSIDVRVVQAAWSADVEGLTTTLRGIAGLRTMMRRTSALLDDAVALLERGACGLSAWDRFELRITPGATRIECDAALSARAGSAADRWLRSWTPLPMPRARIAFAGADLEGFVGPSDANVELLFCGSVPAALDAAHVDAVELARRGGVFASMADADRAPLAVPFGAAPVAARTSPETWNRTASRCMAPLAAGDVVAGDCLYVRVRLAPWLVRWYATSNAEVAVPERAFDGSIELHGRAEAGVLRLTASIDRAALASFIPVVRTR